MTIRKTEEKDTAAVLAVYEDARQYFFHNGIPQWQNGTPNLETLQEDMRRGYSYVLEENGRIIGTACIIEESDPDYLSISGGAWLNDEPYVSVHRTAVANDAKGKGVGSWFFAEAERYARARGYRNLRVDTHPDNHSMQRLIEKNGFTACGRIYIPRENNGPRIAYQKVLGD